MFCQSNTNYTIFLVSTLILDFYLQLNTPKARWETQSFPFDSDEAPLFGQPSGKAQSTEGLKWCMFKAREGQLGWV